MLEPTTTREVALGGIPVVDATVQGPVASAMENLTGEHVNLGGSCPHFSGMSNFNSISVAIDAQVSPKLKAKIWANEFIDFGLLLNPQLGDTRYHLSLSASENSMPTLSLEPTTKTKHIPNVEVWTSAFQVLVGVYTSKYPGDAPALMKYGEVVRDLAARGGNWHYYDTQFRFLRSTKENEMPWGFTHWELWIRAQNFGNSTKTKSLTVSQPSFFVPKGFCRKFHQGHGCMGCSFKHSCFKCGVKHPANSCTFRPPNSATNSRSSGAGPNFRTPSAAATSAARSRTSNPGAN